MSSRPPGSASHQPSIPRPLRCRIKNLDTGGEVHALFNPKDLQVDKQVPWVEHKGSAELPPLEYTKGSGMELSVELLFDTYETREDVYQAYVGPLQALTREIGGGTRRPPMCLFLWGVFPSFMGVITAVGVKYTMFLPNGRPVRATCQVKMKQADRLSFRVDDGPERWTGSKRFTELGTLATREEKLRADKFGRDHRATLEAQGSEDGRLQPGVPVAVAAGRRR